MTQTVNLAASTLNKTIDVSASYLKQNAIPIAGLLIAYYVFKNYVKKNTGGYKLSSRGTSLLSSPSTTAQPTVTSTPRSVAMTSNSNSNLSREEQIRQVRLMQQQRLTEAAKLAAIERKEKEALEKERKNNLSIVKPPPGGKKLGGPSTNTKKSSSSYKNKYNPLMPSSSHTTGYRPARRVVRRG